jgi:hypothetical protein
MNAELNARELLDAFAFVTKGLRGKLVRERAKALIIFGANGVTVQFNDVSANCPAEVFEIGKYALNPFIFRPFLETYGKSDIRIEVNPEGITIGRLRLAHIRVHGRFERPEEAIASWAKLWMTKSVNRQTKVQKDAQSRDAESTCFRVGPR